MGQFTIIKLNPQGRETYRYRGELLQQSQNSITLVAFFDREDTLVEGMLLTRGDRFIETYYTDRWYNIFEIHERGTDALRGWYCNIGLPAQIEGNTLAYVDLALDLLVFTDGRQVILDEGEFNQLDVTADVARQARQELQELQQRFMV